LKARIVIAALLASLFWFPRSVQNSAAIYCYPVAPAALYQACLAYSGGVGQQAQNQNELYSIKKQINNSIAQINALDVMIAGLQQQITAQKVLIARTQAAIDDLNRQIRFGQAALIPLAAHATVRDQLLNERLRYVDSHGSVNYIQLVLTSNSMNQLMNRLVGAQQVAASDRRLLVDLQQEHLQVSIANSALDEKKTEVFNLLKEQQATEADLEANLNTQKAAIAYEQQLEAQLNAQYAQVQAERAAIDAQVAQLAQQYAAVAKAHGGGSGVFAWPIPTCGYGCISQGFGCSSFYLEVYDPNCPWPHKIHTGIDIAAAYGSEVVAADTGVVYLYPNSVGSGNLLVMINGNGYSTYYGHLSRYAPGLKTGAMVPRGMTVAFEGSTGWSTGPHLHFEIRVNGVYKDPCIWLGC